MTRRLSFVVAASLTGSVFLVLGCEPDPGRDVKPMSDPLRPATAAVPSATEIIPPEAVSKSQAGAVSQRVANTEVTITYSRPVARGRVLFGTLVPYDEVWNPGADQATALAVTRDIEVNEERLSAGKYSIWAIPRPDTWTIIFSKASEVYHTPYPGADQDALRLDVTPERGSHMETLNFYFPVVEGKEALLRLHWGDVIVPLSIRVP